MSIQNGIALLFQRVGLRVQGYASNFNEKLFDPPRGFEDYKHKDGRSAVISTVSRGRPQVTYHPAPGNK